MKTSREKSLDRQLYEIAQKHGCSVKDIGSEIHVIGTERHVWPSTGTHDLFVEVSEFPSREAALQALIWDMD